MRKKLLDRLTGLYRGILLSMTGGRQLLSEGITSKLGELKTDLQFSQDQVSHDRFGLSQDVLMSLHSFAKSVSTTLTHDPIRNRLAIFFWSNCAHKMITPPPAMVVPRPRTA